MTDRSPLRLFEGYGVEIEYAIVDAETLAVRPIADRLMDAAGAAGEAEVERGAMAWSNELMLHVVELKTNGPTPALHGLAEAFQGEVRAANGLLEPMGARLLPTGMHPTMDPSTESRLWPREYNEVYRAFDRIFDCRGHGWANLQSTHLNLPFGDDAEFGRLHGAIRVLLPLLPALTASSPIRDGAVAPELDGRMAVYRGNARRVPSVTGWVVPEAVSTREAYERDVLGRIYDDLAPLDPAGTLRFEWVNARGAIARFDRGAIEIRVLDTQECPAADLAILSVVSAALRALAGRDAGWHAQAASLDARHLGAVLEAVVVEAEDATVRCTPLLELLGCGGAPISAGDAWASLVDGTAALEPGLGDACDLVRRVLREGCLARRIRRAVSSRGGGASAIEEVYRRLADSLRDGAWFAP